MNTSKRLKFVVGIVLVSIAIVFCYALALSFLRKGLKSQHAPTQPDAASRSGRPGQGETLPGNTTSSSALSSTSAGGSGTLLKAFIASAMPCPKEADSAALDKLYPILGHIDSKSVASLNAADKSIACLRPWAMGIADTCQRDGLLHWLEYYDGRIAQWRVELAEKRAETDSEKYNRERHEEERRTREWVQAHPFPKMPQCSDVAAGDK